MILRLQTAEIALRLGLALSSILIGIQFLIPPFGDGLFYDRFGPIQTAISTYIPIVQITAALYLAAAVLCLLRRTTIAAGAIVAVLSIAAILSTRLTSFLGMKDLPLLACAVCLTLLGVRRWTPSPRLVLVLIGGATGISLLFHGYTMVALVFHLPSPIPTLIYLELLTQAPLATWFAIRIGVESLMIVLGVSAMVTGLLAFIGLWRQWVAMAVIVLAIVTLLLFGPTNHLFIREYAIIGNGLAVVALTGPWVYVRRVAIKRSRLFPVPDTVPARRSLKTIPRRPRAW